MFAGIHCFLSQNKKQLARKFSGSRFTGTFGSDELGLFGVP
jgi:hypothetical protein